jgi:hypothetical protein
MTPSILIAALSFSSFAWAGKGLPSTLHGVDIPNAHLVTADQGKIFRGAEPGKKVDQLLKMGITDVLIIKNDVKGEVATEVETLRAKGLKKVTHLEIAWKDIEDETENCGKFITALQKIRDVLRTPKRQLYFHCTMGEDRTGLLAGLVRMLQDGWTIEQAFQEEMCGRGYAEGSGKPPMVANTVHRFLTPTFNKLALAIKRGELTWDNLDKSVCQGQLDLMASKKWRCR